MAMWKKALMATGLSLAVLTGGLVYAQQHRAVPALTPQDYMEIQQLYALYAKAADLADGKGYAGTFTPDGEFVSGRAPQNGQGDWIRTTSKGTDSLIRTGSTGGLRHNFINIHVTRTAEGADATCYLLMYTARTNPASLVTTATYTDTLVKTADGWRFKKRVMWRDDDPMSPFKPPVRAQ
jgi:SnoaL-like protein